LDDATGEKFAASQAAEQPIDDERFHDLVCERSRPLLELARLLATMGSGRMVLTRQLSGRLLLESGRMEELLDEYGASHNLRWSRFRALTATLRNFARIGQALSHVQRRLPAYRLQPVASDFPAATGDQLRLVGGVVADVAAGLLEEAGQLGIATAGIAPPPEDFVQQLPPGRLIRNREDRVTGNTATTVAHLATEFLNLAAESGQMLAAARIAPANYADCFPDPVSEERLRHRSARSACASSPSASTTCNPSTTLMSPEPRSRQRTRTCPSCAVTSASSITSWGWPPTWLTTTSGTSVP